MNRKEKIKLLLSERHTRLALVERDLFVFGLYYFSESFKSPSALFHREWCIAFQGSEHLLLIAFRESAKTLWLIIKIVHTICFRQKRFIAYYCYDKKKSAGRLYDIVVHLQTNKKLLRDFGCLFPSAYKSSDDEEENTKRSVTEFITTNLIKVKAMSIGESPRGELFMTKDGTFRPDFVGLDDIDVDKSVSNVDIIEKTYAWIKGEFL